MHKSINFISAKKQRLEVISTNSCLIVRHEHDSVIDEYKLVNCDDYRNKLTAYKSIAHVVKFSQANQITPTTTTDTKSEIAKGESVGVVDSVGVAPLASDLSEQANNAPSDFVACESGVNPPPVAVSSYPAASDTPYKNMQSQRLGAAL